jgi:hypothetical protein
MIVVFSDYVRRKFYLVATVLNRFAVLYWYVNRSWFCLKTLCVCQWLVCCVLIIHSQYSAACKMRVVISNSLIEFLLFGLACRASFEPQYLLLVLFPLTGAVLRQI